jgi:hypothetical protein
VLELDKRLQAIESPPGRLPLGLPELITLFPILVAGVILMLTFVLRRSHLLKTTLQGMDRPAEQSSDRAALELAVNCWFLPPYPNVFRPVLLSACGALLAVIMLRATWLIIAGPATSTLNDLDVELSHGRTLVWGYAVACAAVLLSLGLCRSAFVVRKR